MRAIGRKAFGRRALERECGSCSACCTIKSIDTLGKPSFMRCRHLESGACRIYARRPDECAGYFCAWRLGFGPDTARPDLLSASGVVVDFHFKADIADALGVGTDRVEGFACTVRAGAPFRAGPLVALVRDFMRMGVRHYGCVDLETPDGAPYMLTSDRRAALRMVGLFASTGKAPWNRTPEIIDPEARRSTLESGSSGLWAPALPGPDPSPA